MVQTLLYEIKMKSKEQRYRMRPIGDIHYGSPNCDVDRLKRSIERVHDGEDGYEYYTIGMGDYVENNSADNDRSLATYDKEGQSVMGKLGLSSEQIRRFRELWKPIAPRTIGFLMGNHEDRTMSHDDFKLLFTEPLNIQYLGDKAYIVLRFTYRGQTVREVKILASHSRFGGQKHGTVINAVENAYAGYEGFDVVVFGHTHFTIQDKYQRTSIQVQNDVVVPVESKVFFVNTGTFLMSETLGYDSYTEKKLAINRSPGTVTMEFRPLENKIFGLI